MKRNEFNAYLNPWMLTVLFSVVAIFLYFYRITSLREFNVPLFYNGDALYVLATSKAFLDGDIVPFLSKHVYHLNAPFEYANWNDFPITEELIFFGIGIVGRFTGIFAAYNLAVLSSHVLAAVSFYVVCKYYKVSNVFAISTSVLYSFSHYIFARNSIGHINLSFYWHMPLMLMLTWWIFEKSTIEIFTFEFYFAIFISFICGVLNPYYSWMIVQFILFGMLIHFINRSFDRLWLPFFMLTSIISGFLLVNLDTLYNQFQLGRSVGAVSRGLGGLELYALKIPELIFPPEHRISFWQNYAQNHYFVPALIKGEMGSPYLGFVGVAGSILLCLNFSYNLIIKKIENVTIQSWQYLWVLIYSLGGGVNLLLGSFGLVLFRASNRYSIILLTLAFFYIARRLSSINMKFIYSLIFSILLLICGLYDQLPARPDLDVKRQQEELIHLDRVFSESLEDKLPINSMVFQYPIMLFPEVPPIEKMSDYQNFRPYLFTKNLRYSYGTNKGRFDSVFQSKLSNLKFEELISEIEGYGFSAIVLNKNGMADFGNEKIAFLESMGYERISENQDLISYKLKNKKNIYFPTEIKYISGWYPYDGNYSWGAEAESLVEIFSYGNTISKVLIEIELTTMSARHVSIGNDDIAMKECIFVNGICKIQLAVNLLPGKNFIKFHTDENAERLGGGDLRSVTFGVKTIRVNHY